MRPFAPSVRPTPVIGPVPPRSLTDARLQLHYAAQLAASVGAALLPETKDDSNPNLAWEEPGAFRGRKASLNGVGLWASLNVFTMTLALHTEEAPAAQLSLEGATLAEAVAWLAETARNIASSDLPNPLRTDRYDLPDHHLGAGGAFRADREALATLAAAFSVGSQALGAVRKLAQERGHEVSEPRVWPHHFDLGMIINLPERGEEIGLGLSPGDGSYGEPYFYVSSYPPVHKPGADEPLGGGGFWHEEGWIGAVLTASAIIKDGADGKLQSERIVSYLQDAIEQGA